MERLEVITWPSGITTQAGGTRTKVKLDRPWQVPMADNPNCPLCRKFRNEPSLVANVPAGWSVVQNDFTPFRFHRLIIPEHCWLDKKTQQLGGSVEIVKVLSVARTIMQESRENDLWLGVHVGALAGQNYPHLHWHLLRTIENPPAPTEEAWVRLGKLQTEELIVSGDVNFVVSAGGVRAGSLIINTTRFLPTVDDDLIVDLAEILNSIVDLCGRKFRSQQKKSPDFRLAIHLHKGALVGAEYVPILNHWGFTESYQFTFGDVSKVPIILPWPHYTTAEHLITA